MVEPRGFEPLTPTMPFRGNMCASLTFVSVTGTVAVRRQGAGTLKNEIHSPVVVSGGKRKCIVFDPENNREPHFEVMKFAFIKRLTLHPPFTKFI